MRFFRLIVFLWMLTIVFIGGSLVYGRTKPISNPLDILKVDSNNQLNLMGITPGTTVWENALKILRGNAATNYDLETVYYLNNLFINMDYDPKTYVVRHITIKSQSGSSPPITLGDIVETWGTPCSFNPDTSDPNELDIVYPFAHITIILDSERINTLTSISTITIPSAKIECDSKLKWLGFTLYRRYIDFYLNSSTP